MTPTMPHAPGEHGEPPVRIPSRGPVYYVLRGLKALASLQLTVGLFVLGILLVFFGTLAQLDNGVWTVVDKYFWSTIVMVPFELVHKFLNVFWKEAFPDGQSEWTGAFPLPGGILLGGAMLVNLLAAHAVRFRLTWKRSGIFLIHGGLLFLFVGEFITREYAVEQRMTIETGKSTDFTEDARHVQLVFVDRSAPETERVVAVPQELLRGAKGRVTHPELPVDIEVVGDYMVNSEFTEAAPGAPNPATVGWGQHLIGIKRKEVAGVDTEQKTDTPTVYVKLFKKGTDEALGVHYTSLWLYMMGRSDYVEADGKRYELVLRPKRYYKPYRIHLDQFRFDRYIGTGKPKNYSSDVRVYDQSGGEPVITQRISMNEPLRYAGETFYQQSFDRSEKTTILQVVKNPGWLLPYISCAVVGFGLLLHFGIFLVQFLLRTRAAQTLVSAAPPLAPRTVPVGTRYFPWLMLVAMVIYLLSVFGRMTPKTEPYDLDAFGRIPVVEGGRVKPLDTVARVNLRIVSGREEWEDEAGKKQPAIRWYLDVLSSENPEDRGPAWKHRVIRVDNEQVLSALELRPVEGLRYSLEELVPKFPIIRQRVAAAGKKVDNKQKLDQTETKFKELVERINVVSQIAAESGALSEGRGPLFLPPQEEGGTWTSLGKVRRDIETQMRPQLQSEFPISDEILAKMSEKEKAALSAKLRTRIEELESAALAKNPPAADWVKLLKSYRAKQSDEFNAVVREYRAKHAGNVSDVNPAHDFSERLVYGPFNGVGKLRTEVTFNRFQPFYQCTGLYVIGFVLSIIGFAASAAQKPGAATALRRSGTNVLILALVVHTVALFARMYLMQRVGVFVTNLYSSAVFIGWGCVALCLVLERLFPIGVGNVVAAALGLATCIVAHNLGTQQDTLEMMEAVLDTNFWLATHVTTVTLGYTATFVAGFLGAIYVLCVLGTVVRDSFESRGEPTVGALLAFGTAVVGLVAVPMFFLWFLKVALEKFELVNPILLDGAFGLAAAGGIVYGLMTMLLRVSSSGVDAHGKLLQGQVPQLAQPIVGLALTPESSKILGQMVYGVVAFATLLSFVGTVLGGIWADQSWGRFWGWDPKENGAVLIVLWNSLILHARWAGIVKDRGVAVLAVFGNTITAWSWFGTNQLGIGLHAYGFDSRLADGCFNFWLLQFVVLVCGAVIPRHFWASATRRGAAQKLSVAEVVGTSAPLASDAGTTAHNETAAGANGTVPANSVNGHANGSPNGNGPSHRDKGKKHGKRR
ncbi:cytochrome c-type biogenesis protein : Probable cytochrome c-type biogenesis protein OS=Planctomyces maris DSM 8797 GN=PM8797T_06360 PE=4 SV=1: ResB: Cytochrom_C_asm [Gemmata massiliana]|uniref:Cytochrome c assembly protein domain-containing protein n=1 Tax=Gemmata massiliana TaxID=1210884 RepID=A0A6P2CY55_9BACT|nr:cytochrome c biogenesis protein ResB [Gemmata massiliana]VTR92724.1 cytochrome c-type biogenesis protein : Probable cytochrome c-type biogenesis protein OS=Planctomyces maris DSM 8797 GN=PM8797T_06360 PE=4 SV=1: ResB: Cytochrom_C_asm [Gemmata massiliana]